MTPDAPEASTYYCPLEGDAGWASQPTWAQNGTELIWQSSPLLGTWFAFHGQETVTFTLPPVFANANIYEIAPQVGISPVPWCGDASNFTTASGNLTEVSAVANVGDAGLVSISVFNATCEGYFAHVTVLATTAEPVVTSDDAGFDAAAAADAASDADASGDADAAPDGT